MNKYKIYISASWKRREEVRSLAESLRKMGHDVYDFTDPECHKSVCPPEKFPEPFDPEKHLYHEYLGRSEWYMAVKENYEAISECDWVILLLPCGIDSTADWAAGVGMGKKTVVVGHPNKGERSPVHLWANYMAKDIKTLLESPLFRNGHCACCNDTGHVNTVIEGTFISSNIDVECGCKNKKE